MTIVLPTGRLLFDNPARYQIRVQGSISQSWSDRLEGLAIRLDTDEQAKVVSILEGELLDQAALLGVLVTLYELHVPLLLVKCMSCEAAADRYPFSD